MLIYIFYHIIIVIGSYVLLGGFELVYEVLDVYSLNVKYLECRSDEYFIFYDRYEC